MARPASKHSHDRKTIRLRQERHCRRLETRDIGRRPIADREATILTIAFGFIIRRISRSTCLGGLGREVLERMGGVDEICGIVLEWQPLPQVVNHDVVRPDQRRNADPTSRRGATATTVTRAIFDRRRVLASLSTLVHPWTN